MLNLNRLYEQSVKLEYTKHAKERLKERTGGGLRVAPTYVKFTKANIVKVKYSKSKHVSSIAVKIKYTPTTTMTLVVVPYSWMVKTLWFEKNNRTKKRQYPLIAKECFKKSENIEENICSENKGTEEIGETGIGENVENVSRNLGRKSFSRWRTLFRNFRRKLGVCLLYSIYASCI